MSLSATSSTSSRPPNRRVDRDDAGHAGDEAHQELGVGSAPELAGEPHLAVGDPHLEGGLLDPQRAQEGLADLALDLLVAARERAHEIGAGDDPDERAVVVDDREALDPVLGHRTGGERDVPVDTDRDRGRRHRIARGAGLELPLVHVTVAEQPRDDPAVPRLGPALLEEDVRLRHHPQHHTALADHRQARDAVLDEDRGHLAERRLRPDRDRVPAHELLDLHASRPPCPRSIDRATPWHIAREPRFACGETTTGGAPPAGAHGRTRPSSDLLGHHLDRAARALGRADPASLAVVVVDRVGLAGSAELDHRVVGAHAVAVVAGEAVAAREAAAGLVERRPLGEPPTTSSNVDCRRASSSCGWTERGASA